MNTAERPRSLRLQQQQQQQQQQLNPVLGKCSSGFYSVRFKPEPPFALDMDDDTKTIAVHRLTPPRQHALRTCTRGYVDKLTIGPDYQVDVPDYVPLDNAKTYRDDKEVETLIWSPNEKTSEPQLMHFMTMATGRKNNYSVEQAITMLQAHGHDCNSALEQVSRYANTRAIWSTTERQRFELLLARHGTRFERIKEAMPWRSLAEIIDFYYAWVSAQHKLSFPHQVLAWRALLAPSCQSDSSGARSTVLGKLKLPVLPVSLMPQKDKSPPEPALKDAELLALAQDNRSAWQCVDFVRQVGLLQAQLLFQRSKLSNNEANWLDDYDDLCRVLKAVGTRNFREWRPLDKQLLVLALEEYGCDFEKIVRVVRSKSEFQVRQYYEHHKSELNAHVEHRKLSRKDCPMTMVNASDEPTSSDVESSSDISVD